MRRYLMILRVVSIIIIRQRRLLSLDYLYAKSIIRIGFDHLYSPKLLQLYLSFIILQARKYHNMLISFPQLIL